MSRFVFHVEHPDLGGTARITIAAPTLDEARTMVETAIINGQPYSKITYDHEVFA